MEDQRKEIYEAVVKVLKSFKKGMRETTDGKSKYDLYGKKKVTVYNKEMDGMYFASVIIKKGFVGFYYFPQYANPKLLAQLPDNLKKCLKGKSCFHLKKLDAELLKSIKEYAKIGYDAYFKMGWI
jgi:hypothetical protein